MAKPKAEKIDYEAEMAAVVQRLKAGGDQLNDAAIARINTIISMLWRALPSEKQGGEHMVNNPRVAFSPSRAQLHDILDLVLDYQENAATGQELKLWGLLGDIILYRAFSGIGDFALYQAAIGKGYASAVLAGSLPIGHPVSMSKMEQRAVSLNHRSNAKRTLDREVISYTLKEAARITGLSVSTIRRHHGSGRLRFFRVGGRTLVDGASLRRLLGVEE